MEFVDALVRLTTVALPFFILGLIVAGLLDAYVPRERIERHLGAAGIGPVIYATLAGALLPGDVCLSMPIVSWLRRAGAGTRSVAAFLVSSPLLALEELPLTYVLLGPLLTAARVVSTLAMGLAAGALAPLALAPVALPPMRRFAPAAALTIAGRPQLPVLSIVRARQAAVYTLAIARRLAPYLAAGLVLAAAFETLFPEGALARLVPIGPLQVLIAASIGLPLYLCEGEEVPLALALVAAGGSPGAALAFMIAGPGICTTSVAMVGKEFGRRYATGYVAFFWLGAVVLGLALNAGITLVR